ncbi:MAG: haloacid dehalogenase [Acidimicrobiales bacterium]
MACRAVIQASGRAIRAVHRHDTDAYTEHVSRAAAELRRAQEVLAPYPGVYYAGFLHDAAKEYAEARLTAALVESAVAALDVGRVPERPACVGEHAPELPDATTLGVGLPAWLNGLAEAASELRRHLLDRLRAGELAVAEELLTAMEDAYDLLVTVEYPDAITGGLRRSADSLRAVLERSRSDLTLTLVQARLQAALERP